MSVSTTVLTRYQGKFSFSICVSMLCVAIVFFGGVLFISSCVNIGTSLDATLGCLTSFIFYCVTIGISLGSTLGSFSVFFFVPLSLDVVSVVDVVLRGINVLLLILIGLVQIP